MMTVMVRCVVTTRCPHDGRSGVGGWMGVNRRLYLTDNMHANAKLTPRGRREMIVDLQRHQLTLREAAASRSVSEKTARRWFARVREEGITAGVFERSCVPKLQPRRTPKQLEAQVLRLRRERRSYA